MSELPSSLPAAFTDPADMTSCPSSVISGTVSCSTSNNNTSFNLRATTQYHAQLFSGQQQLQKRQLQQMQQTGVSNSNSSPNSNRTHGSSNSSNGSGSNSSSSSSSSSNGNSNSNNHSNDGISHSKHSVIPLTLTPPNLYRTSLRLAAELEMHAWWTTLINILSESSFHAIRASLSVPQDSSDPWSGAWGLKAVWSKPGSTTRLCSGNDGDSFSTANSSSSDNNNKRGSILDVEKDYFVHSHSISSYEGDLRCFDRLQALESDPEPLLNNTNAHRIIRRNAVIVLSREYRRRSQGDTTKSLHLHHFSFDDRDMFKRALRDQTGRSVAVTAAAHQRSTQIPPTRHLNDVHDDEDMLQDAEILADAPNFDISANERSSTDINSGASTEVSQQQQQQQQQSRLPSLAQPVHDYDEYEQQQPSPWSQSPAPSPAMMDPDFNPFFQSTPGIDDDAFNPSSPESYESSSMMRFPIPASNVHSVVHIPLVYTHDMDFHHSRGDVALTDPTPSRSQPAPFAIISFLSPIVPFPSMLLKSLTSLTPFISASCSNALEHARKRQISPPPRRQPSRRRSSFKNTARKMSFEDVIPRQDTLDYALETIPKSPDTSSVATATAADVAPPAFLTSISNFTQQSLETVASDRESKEEEDIIDDRGDSLEDIRLSPTSMAIIEGWNAISPTTGMRISPSVPPAIASKFLRERPEKYKEVSPLSPPTQPSVSLRSPSSPKHQRVFQRHQQTMPRIRSYKSFHNMRRRMTRIRRHSSSKSSHGKENRIDRLFVAPKSSLLRLVIDGIPIHVFTCSTMTGHVTWVNNRILQYTGRSLQDHLGSGWLQHMHSDDQKACRTAWNAAFEGGNGFAGEYRLRRFDGEYRYFLWRIVPLRDLKGRIIHWFGTCTDIHDQHIAKENNLRQKETESSERKYRLLAEAIPQIVFTFSPGVGVTYANEKWESYAGLDFYRTRGFGFMSQVHPEDRAKLQLPDLAPHKTAGVIWQSEIRLLSKEHDYRWFLVKSISVDELDTGDVRWFGTCTDINDHKLLEHKLKEAHDAAQKSMESKTRFLSNMSHEIRTPLIGITGMLTFLLDTDLSAEQLDYVHTIQHSAESLLVVINDILDLSKVEAGKMKLEFEPFRLVTMIEDANELLSTLAIQKGLELSFWVDESVPDIVVGDRVRLRQVLLNLIGNAIKFTTEGEIFTQCTVQEMNIEKNELTLLFEVVDTGSGFDAEGEAVMFKPFSQVDSSSTRKHGGSGLGLVISRQLIELHGGEMRCKSKKGEGSTFYFTVKFSIPPPQTQPRPQTPQNETNYDPFFRTSVCTATPPMQQQQAELSPSKNGLFVPSPLAHSKKHSQATELPTSMELLQDALLNKAASMRLVPPPIRSSKHPQQPMEATAAATSSDGDKDAEKHIAPTTPICMPAEAAGTNLLSFNNGVILPPRTPNRGAPLRLLVVSEWQHAQATLIKHIRAILGGVSHSMDYQLHVATSHIEAMQMIAYPQGPAYDYIVINLSSDQQVLAITRLICGALQHKDANTLVVTTPMQRSLIMESAKEHEAETIPANCSFVFKPIKRSKLNWYFGLRDESLLSLPDDPSAHKGDIATTPGSMTAAAKASAAAAVGGSAIAPDSSRQRAATQKELFRRMEEDVGNKGFRVMLVEDNLVNQKVLTRYLVRVGLEVDVAADGEECVNLFVSRPHDYYSLILCDLFMPVKDGYEATRDIRRWEDAHLVHEDRRIPIVALSANVMSDVAQKCMECGFSTYISKPVNFATLSDVIRKHLLRPAQ
ncbi:hypothetical protein BX666DRAFT_2029129 [Dichotomocladium elegans]|nr:hypothetical protein BX666DRAFT_2029129 [Dichotomocladium elegans]